VLNKDRQHWQSVASFEKVGMVMNLLPYADGLLVALNQGGAAMLGHDGTVRARTAAPYPRDYGLRLAKTPDDDVWLGGISLGRLKRVGPRLNFENHRLDTQPAGNVLDVQYEERTRKLWACYDGVRTRRIQLLRPERVHGWRNPYARLVQATNGDFYETTSAGGANFAGTVFKITPSGTLTTLYTFCSQGGSLCTDGADPLAGLVQATNGDLYGTASYGVTNCASSGCGTVFKITPDGALTTIHSFALTDGEYPAAALIQGTDGELFSTT
jgi:uncharacterized repeat protein (TIGR03803 family)